MSVLKIKDSAGNWMAVPVIKGEKGDRGAVGATGPKYTLTEQDKSAIAALVLDSLAAAETEEF